MQGSDVHAVNRSKQTALHVAAMGGHEAVVRFLYDAGNPPITLKLEFHRYIHFLQMYTTSARKALKM